MNSLCVNDELEKIDTVDIYIYIYLFPFLFLTYSNTHISGGKIYLYLFKYLSIRLE